MLKATFDGNYRKKDTGKLMSRYVVSGTKEELEKYAASQGNFLRVDEKKGPLYFSQDFLGKSVPLGFTQDGRVYADTSEMENAASVAARFGGNLGQAIADAAAAKFLGLTAGNTTAATVAVDDAPESVSASAEGDDLTAH